MRQISGYNIYIDWDDYEEVFVTIETQFVQQIGKCQHTTTYCV